MKTISSIIALLALVSFGVKEAYPLEKIRFGAPSKHHLRNYLPVLAAEEGGFAKQNGVALEYFPFRSGSDLNAAMIGGHINIGFNLAGSIIQGIAAGVPVVIVADNVSKADYYFWVRADSPFRTIKDIKGAKLGVHRLRTGSHAFGLFVVKAENLEKDVKFVATGGIREVVAALKAGIIDVATGFSFAVFAKLALAGEVRPLVSISDYLPAEWLESVVIARNEFIRSQPDIVRRTVRSLLQGIEYLRRNPKWGIEKIKSVEGQPEAVARQMLERDLPNFTRDGKINPKGLENVVNFLVGYDIIARDKVPSVEKMFAPGFTP